MINPNPTTDLPNKQDKQKTRGQDKPVDLQALATQGTVFDINQAHQILKGASLQAIQTYLTIMLNPERTGSERHRAAKTIMELSFGKNLDLFTPKNNADTIAEIRTLIEQLKYRPHEHTTPTDTPNPNPVPEDLFGTTP